MKFQRNSQFNNKHFCDHSLMRCSDSEGIDFLHYTNIFIFIIGYFIVLLLIYDDFISVIYEYYGFINKFAMQNLLFSIFCAIAYLTLNVKQKCFFDNISTQVFFILVLISYIPNCILYVFGVTSIQYFIAFQIYWYLLGGVLWLIQHFQLIIYDYQYSDDNLLSNAICTFLCVVVLLIFSKYSNFKFLFRFRDVYDLRLLARTYEIPLVLKYLLGFARASIPIYLVNSLLKRKYYISIILIFIQFCNYSIDGMKSVYFITFAAIVVSIFYNDTLFKYIPGISFLSCLGSLILHKIGNSLILDMIIRRVLYIPALLNFYYFDYVQNNGPNYFNNLLKFIGLVNYQPDIPFTIGKLYFNRPQMASNNGLFGDAFWNLGLFSLFVFPLLLGALFYVYNFVTQGLSGKLKIFIALQVAVGLLDSSLTTLLLSHGIAFQIIVLLFLPRVNSESISMENKNE